MQCDSIIVTKVAHILLSDVLGANASLVEYGGASQAYPRISQGVTDAVFELWPSSKNEQYVKYVLKQGTVVDGGTIGYAGKVSWFVPTKLTETYPSRIFDSWRAFRDPSVLQYFPAAGTTQPARTLSGGYLCDSAKYPYCSNGIFVPPQCQSSQFASCREFWAVDPSYSAGENEQRIVTLQLSLVVVYVGAAQFESKVRECARQGVSGCLFYYCNFSTTAVGQPENFLTCDWTTELLQKIYTSSLRTRAPQIASFIQAMKLGDIEINNLLQEYNRTQDYFDAACSWVKRSASVWSSWIPPVPPGFATTLDIISTSDTIATVTLSLSGILLATYPFTAYLLLDNRRTPALRAQSPTFIFLILLGVSLTTLSVVLDTLPPSWTTCVSRVATLSVGMAVVLSSTIVKTVRIYLVFGNKRIRGSALATSRLVSAVAAAVMVHLILVAVWSEVYAPQAVLVQTSLTRHTLVCGVDPARTGGTSGAGVLGIMGSMLGLHGIMLVAACVYSFKVRKVATEYNESRFIALSSYNIFLAVVIVFAIEYSAVSFRAQYAIRSLVTLFSISGVYALMVLRPVAESILTTRRSVTGDGAPVSPSVIRNAIMSNVAKQPENGLVSLNSFMPSNGTAPATGGAGGKEQRDVGKSTVACSMNVSTAFAMRKAGLFRRWRPVTLCLIHGAKRVLLLVQYDDELTGTTYSANVAASLLTRGAPSNSSPASSSDSHACQFQLFLNTQSYVVQASTHAQAEQWARDINLAFTGDATVSGLPRIVSVRAVWASMGRSAAGSTSERKSRERGESSGGQQQHRAVKGKAGLE
ncbi:7 transmembrane sweet-taste receptor of 3 GCPR-domain-containing protein [Catenaria anguillulae PL171]|uniref:7 transmembrane sweet-taste receptor of 3 GCPR-domain-containing protein n=1 Tax=Catenaria anguillulae PL171 TaxID=765915 RepID=A0A1Y2HN26_9FUNG|nr:7 transmembrane sweet-taste receptor of 3 GCPR-domain-containing protein [Catenaria anguillulae PL171]